MMHFIPLLFAAGALAGHIALAVTALNVSYGQGWIARGVLKVARVVHDLWLVVGTPWLVWLCYRSGWPSEAGWGALPAILQAYLATCVVIGIAVVPGVTIARRLRRLPAAQLSNHGRIVDIAAELGSKPIGHSSHRLPHRIMSRWPFNEQFQLELLERTYRLPRVPAAWDGLSILHLSDLHFTGTVAREYFERVIDLSNELDCDLVAITGDLVDRPWCYEWVPALFGRLRSRFGVYAILGNHDSWRDHDRIRRDLVGAGIRVLSGRWELASIRGEPLVIAGTEYPWMGRLPELAAAPHEAFRLLLSHTPDNAPWAARQSIDLVLAGHNHAGQVRLPIIGPVFMPSRFGRRFDAGAFQLGPTLLHVSRGVSGKHPFRFGCRPEVTKLVLRSVNQVAAQSSA